jgi:lysophospholipid acyltransferase (LPLAT)-like uncharacterized protein
VPLRRLRRSLSRLLVVLCALALPRLYLLYMGLVWKTSRIEKCGLSKVADIRSEHNGAVALLWHDEVLSAAYAYPFVGFRPHTLASRSNAGELITRLLERCGYVVFRGGSSSGRSRRRAGALREMIDYMRRHDGVLYGLTVDGSRGPAYRLKRGGLVLARECGKPILLVRTAYARCLRLRTWDRSALPLPFNTIRYDVRGPFLVPEEARTREGLEHFRRRLEGELIELTAASCAALGQPRPRDLVAQ